MGSGRLGREGFGHQLSGSSGANKLVTFQFLPIELYPLDQVGFAVIVGYEGYGFSCVHWVSFKGGWAQDTGIWRILEGNFGTFHEIRNPKSKPHNPTKCPSPSDPGPGSYRNDELKISQAVSNVLANVISDLPPTEGWVSPRVYQNGTSTFCEISDNGKGFLQDIGKRVRSTVSHKHFFVDR